jgi:hypothetical protein
MTWAPLQTSPGELGWRWGGGGSGFSRSSSTNYALPPVTNARPNSAAAAAAAGGGFLGDGTISGWDSGVFQVCYFRNPASHKKTTESPLGAGQTSTASVPYYRARFYQCRFPNPYQSFLLDSVSGAQVRPTLGNFKSRVTPCASIAATSTSDKSVVIGEILTTEHGQLHCRSCHNFLIGTR